MFHFLRPLVLIKTAIIVFSLKCCSAKIDSDITTQPPPVFGSNTLEQLPANIYKRFKITNFTSKVVKSTILLSWNIETEKKDKEKGNPNRTLTIFENNNKIDAIAITIENVCKVNGVPSTTCQYQYPKADCVNYKFILGSKINEALITTVPVKKKTTTFELTDNETNPVKLTWKIECNATSMSPVPVSITNNGKRVDHTVEAVCNSTHQICEIYLNRTVMDPCISSIININGECVLFNATIYSMNNKISVSNLNQIAIEWTETTQIACPVPSSFNYNLVIQDNEKNQKEDVSVQNWCNISPLLGNKQKRQLNFNKNGQSTPCNRRENNFVFKNILKSCVNYTVYVFRSEFGNTLQAEVYKNSFVIKTFEPEDIQNLRAASLSSSRFELQWEIFARCRKVKNFTVSIASEKDYMFIQNISLSPYKTKCDDSASTCTVTWMYDQNLTSCKQYFIHVERSTIYLTTPPPGTVSFIADSSKRNTSSSFDVEWYVPIQCRIPLTSRKTNESNENSSLISSASAKQTDVLCSDEYCHMRWRFEKKLEPCITYTLNLGLFTQDITTLPDFYGGIANNVTIRREVSESPDKSTTLVIRWDHPHCQKTKVLKWEISIRNSRTPKLSNATIVPISNLEYSYKFVGVKACETYSFAILTKFENRSDFYSTEEEHFQADCPVKLLVPISVIAGLLFIAIIIAFFLSKKRKTMEALEKDNEHNINKLSPFESRIPSISRGRLSSFNHNRTSCASRNSRNSFDENAEMDLDCLPQMTKRPLNIRDICSFDVGQARMEFFLINKLAEIETKKLPHTIAERPENKIKNRFLNTHPYDFNRVLLLQSEDDQNDGYINASFIPGFAGNEKEYIAAQGPKNNTLGDFWQMILEQDVKLIAMVTSLYERGKKKCEKYWPGEDELVIYGDDTQLELLQETTYTFCTIRNILVTKAPDVKREIQQFHFTAWPDFETPDQPEELIRFIEIVRRQARQWNLTSPIVIHCSAGVGRTGTFIALDYLIQQVLITDLVDIPKTVRHLRRFRLSMVQSEAQYVFLYSCIAHYVKTRLSQLG